MRIELACCTSVLLNEIADPKAKQVDVSQTYCLALMSSEKTDWGQVNRAILDRWSMSGLERIKKMAWSGKCFEGIGDNPK
jgi:hypothetical protein